VTTPGITVVICCHNSATRLPPTLEHLAAQQVPADLAWDVLIIDNASTDGTGDAARRHWPSTAPPLTVVPEPELGLGHARRRAFLEARHEIVSFIDDDNWIAPDWVATVARVFARHEAVAACGGFSTAVCETAAPPWFEHCTTLYAVGPPASHTGDITESIGQLWGAGLSVRKAAWAALVQSGFTSTQVGRTGAGFGGGEDTELCLALRLAGWRLWLEPSLKLRHYLPAGRLDWRYLRRLHRGSGRATVGADPYHFALRGNRGGLDHQRRTWWWQALGALTRIVRHPITVTAMIFSDLEGNPAALRVEEQVGRLSGLLATRSAYDHLIRKVDTMKFDAASRGWSVRSGTPRGSDRRPPST
jgi:glycosyltransferase involved in cell wall biosynthesis